MTKQKTKPAAKPAKKAADSERELLAKELKGLIPKLDGEGLAFLVEQARVHLYNMQVDELNRAAIAAEEAAAKTRSMSGKAKAVQKPKSGREGGRKGYSITGSESGSSFYLICPNDEIMFTKTEMSQLAKIANGKGTDLEIRERLFNWFERERRDAFSSIPIGNKFDDRLKTLAGLLKKSFKTGG